MKFLALVIASFGIASTVGALHPACAKDAPRAAAERYPPGIKYDGKRAVTLHYGDLSVTIDGEREADRTSRVPVFTGRYRDQVVFSFRSEEV